MDNPVVNKFYFIGGTLRLDTPSYVHRRADDELYNALIGGRFCYVLTSRQMGKSSLMVRTTIRLRKEASMKVVILDLQSIGQNVTTEQWYFGLLLKISGQLGLSAELEDYWRQQNETSSPIGPLQRFMTALKQVIIRKCDAPVVIFVDEIDYVRSLNFSTDEFFAGIRECYTSRPEDPELERLMFCLLGVASPSDLIKNVYTTPFNIGERIELNDFTQKEAEALGAGLGRDRDLNLMLLDRIFYWTNGHPYLTQRFCQAVANDPSIGSSHAVDRLCEQLFLSAKAQQQDDNLIFARDRIVKVQDTGEKDALLDLYCKAFLRKKAWAEDKDPLVETLKLSGITRVENGNLRVRNNIYKTIFNLDWIRANRSDAETIRRKEAYRRGLIKAGGAALAVLLVLGFLFYRVLAEKENALTANSITLEAQKRMLATQDSLKRSNANLNALTINLHRVNMSLDSNLLTQSSLKTEAQRSAAELKIALENTQRETNRARSNFLIYKANELIDKYHNPGASMDSLRRAWYLDNSNTEITKVFYKIIPFRIIPDNRHYGLVHTVFFSPDGSKIISASDDSTVKILSVSGDEIMTLRNFTAPVKYAAFTPDGTKIITVSGNECRLWSAKGDSLGKYVHKDRINSAAFSPDGTMVVTASDDGSAGIWNIVNGQLIPLKGHKGKIISALFGKNSDKVLTSSTDSTARLWDLHGNTLVVFKGHGSKVNSATFNPDETRIITAAGDEYSFESDNTATVWNLKGDTIFTLRGHSEPVLIAQYSPDGSIIATGSEDHQIILWDKNGHLIKKFDEHSSSIKNLAFTADSKRILSVSADRSVKLWPVATNDETFIDFPVNVTATAAVFSRKEDMIVTASENGIIQLWSPDGNKKSFSKRHTNFINSVFFSPDGSEIVTSSFDQTAVIWHLMNSAGPIVLTHSDVVLYANFSRDGKYVLTTSGNSERSIRIWTNEGRYITTLHGHLGRVNFGMFSTDGSKVLSASADGTVKEWLWNRADPECIHTYRHPREVLSAVYGPGNRVVTACADNKIRIWDNNSGPGHAQDSIADYRSLGMVSYDSAGNLLICSENKVLRRTPAGKVIGAFTHSQPVKSVAVSQDGARIITAASDNIVKAWDTGDDRQPLFTLTGSFAALAPNGRKIVTISGNNMHVRLWSIDAKDVFTQDQR